MIRRIALVGTLVGILVGWLAAPGCYNTPNPACGFFCGTGNACPDSYTCNTSDNRCHLNGSEAMHCPGPDAGPIDAPDSLPGEAGNAAPTVVSTVPVANAMGASVTTEISAVLSEDVTNVTTATFTLVTGSTPISGTVFYSSAADVATFTPDVQLAERTIYTATLSSGITDLDGLPLVSHSWSFTTGADTVAPFVTQQDPVPGLTGVPVSTTVTAVFDEPVVNVSATTFTLMNGATAISGTVTYAAATRTATFTPASALPTSTVLTATLTGAITDAAGNPLASAPVTWQFTTVADTTAPAVTARTPMTGATNVPVTSTVTATFSEAVMGVSATTFTLAAGATPITGTVTYAAGTRTATFTPDTALAYSTAITATLTAGITDTAGNPLASAPVTWMFTTAADTTPPMVQSHVPATGAMMVATSTTIAVTFDEPVMNVTTTSFVVNDGSAVAGSLASSQGGKTWTFTPTAALMAASNVTVTLTAAITDTANNPLAAAPVIFMFTTQ